MSSRYQLNSMQRRAVKYGSNIVSDKPPGPLLINAGAGTGKTGCIAHLINGLLPNGVDADDILALTFTKKAAIEMKTRVSDLLWANGSAAGASEELPWCRTFHSAAVRLLRQHGREIGLQSNFTILDSSAMKSVMEDARRLTNMTKIKSFPDTKQCLEIYSRKVNTQKQLGTLLCNKYPDLQRWRASLNKVFKSYAQEKLRQNVLDFDDLLLRWLDLMKQPDTARRIDDMFDHVLIDEFQDTNALQMAILKKLKPDGSGVTAVGDSYQAIFGFRGCDVQNMIDFEHLFERKCKVIRLEQNYRSTQRILSAANTLMRSSDQVYGKGLQSDLGAGIKPQLVTAGDGAAQAEFVVDQVQLNRKRGRKLRDQAVLYREKNHSHQLELALKQVGIRYRKQGGKMSAQSEHVSNVLALLRWIENPADHVSGNIALYALPGISKASAGRALSRVKRLADLYKRPDLRPKNCSAARWDSFTQMLRKLDRSKLSWPKEVRLVFGWYSQLLAAKIDTSHEQPLLQLEALASSWDGRRSFLTDAALDPSLADSVDAGANDEDDYLTLSTIHSAKGREWNTVYVLDVIDGGIPSFRAQLDETEEERRLLYVAMTRAKRRLFLIAPKKRASSWQPGQLSPRAAQPSQFLEGEIEKKFKKVFWKL
jgi:DNA helicase-2/ATP-dependent DNA helicase PcrA